MIKVLNINQFKALTFPTSPQDCKTTHFRCVHRLQTGTFSKICGNFHPQIHISIVQIYISIVQNKSFTIAVFLKRQRSCFNPPEMYNVKASASSAWNPNFKFTANMTERHKGIGTWRWQYMLLTWSKSPKKQDGG